MKEIKYQVYIEKDYIEGKPAAIYPVSGLEFDSEGKLLRVSFWPDNNAPRSLTLEFVKLREFTGLKDRNGVEIYEGHILRCPTIDGGTEDVLVYWSEKDLAWYGDGSESRDELVAFEIDKSEIIGNKYQNPELLTT